MDSVWCCEFWYWMCRPQISRCVCQSLSVPGLDHLYHWQQPTWICRIQQQCIHKLTQPPFIFSFSHTLHHSLHKIPISLLLEIIWRRVLKVLFFKENNCVLQVFINMWRRCIVILLFILYLFKNTILGKLHFIAH